MKISSYYWRFSPRMISAAGFCFFWRPISAPEIIATYLIAAIESAVAACRRKLLVMRQRSLVREIWRPN